MPHYQNWIIRARRSAVFFAFLPIAAAAGSQTDMEIYNCPSSHDGVEVAAFDDNVGNGDSAIKTRLEPGSKVTTHCSTTECTVIFITDTTVVKRVSDNPEFHVQVKQDDSVDVSDSADICE